MKECLFKEFCMEQECQRICPSLIETTYLMQRNEFHDNDSALRRSVKQLDAVQKLLKSESLIKCVRVRRAKDNTENTVTLGNLLTYVAICNSWRKNGLSPAVYHLRYINHIDALQRSWSKHKPSDALEMEQIWINESKLLIVSGMDFVDYNDFRAQTILGIVHSRLGKGLPTILVVPEQSLVGKSMFLNHINSMISDNLIEW